MSHRHSGIFTPATLLIQQLPIARKFFLILLVFTLPMAYLSWKSVAEKQQQIDFHQGQSDGLAILSSIADGDLNRRAEVQGSNEIRNIGDNLNHMARQLAELVHIAYSRAPAETSRERP